MQQISSKVRDLYLYFCPWLCISEGLAIFQKNKNLMTVCGLFVSVACTDKSNLIEPYLYSPNEADLLNLIFNILIIPTDRMCFF